MGIFAALATAWCWAIATRLYHRCSLHLSSIQLTLIKGVVSLVLLGILLIWRPATAINDHELLLLALSGALGIGIGDLCFFAAMRRLGAKTALQIEVLAAPLALLLGMAGGSNAPGPLALIGMVVILAAVLGVVSGANDQPVSALQRWHGLALGLVAAACQAGGLVLSHLAMQAQNQDLLATAELRLAAGVSVTGLIWLVTTKRQWLWPAKTLWLPLTTAIVIGTAMAMVLQQLAVRHAHPGLVQTLLATAPLWALVLARWHGERPSKRAIGGALLAVVGVALLLG